MPAPVRLLLASSNPGKLREYEVLAASHPIELAPVPDLDRLPPFQEKAPTFAENAAGKALHYSRFAAEKVIADDSGLVVPALGGAPGPGSARYAGPGASDAPGRKSSSMLKPAGVRRTPPRACTIESGTRMERVHEDIS